MRAGALAMLPLLIGCHAVIDPGRHVGDERDAGAADAGTPDAGRPDGATNDAGPGDPDAGLPEGECASAADCDAPAPDDPTGVGRRALRGPKVPTTPVPA